MEKIVNLLVLYLRNEHGDYEYAGIAIADFKDDCCEIMSTSIEITEEDLLNSTPILFIEDDEYEINRDSKLAFISFNLRKLIKKFKFELTTNDVVKIIINEYIDSVLYDSGTGLYSKIPLDSYQFKTSDSLMIKNPNLEENKEKINIKQIIEDIKRKFVAQEEVVESIVSNIYINQMLVKSDDRDLISTSKAAILLDGPTGTGKTAILNEVANKLNLPIVIAKSSDYSTTGYVGDSLSDILSTLLEQANGNLELAQRGIVCMDEIDKLATEKSNEIKMKKAVQHDLLAFIGGSKYNVKKGMSSIEFDTTNLTFIAMGAFTNLSDQKKEKPKLMGFKTTEEQIKNEEQIYEIKDQDYIDYGLERELIGRLTLKTHTNAYEVEDFKRILLESEISPLKMFIKTLKALGVKEITYDDEFIELVSNKAYESEFGARGLQSIFLDIRNNLAMELIENNLTNIHLSKEMFEKVKQKSLRKY